MMNAVSASDVERAPALAAGRIARLPVRRAPRAAGAVIGAALLLGACVEPPPRDVAEGASATRVDSAGIEIVTYATLDPGALEQWEIGDEPLTVLGDDARGVEHQFGFINGLARLSDGRLMVALEQSEILAFDSTGNFVSRIARKGSGPGEFTTLAALHLIRGDSLLAYQHFPESVTLFDSSGTYVRSARLVRPSAQQEFAEFAAFEFKSAFPDGSLLVHRHGGEREITVGEVHSDSVRPLRVTATGEVLADFGTRWDKDQTRLRVVAASNGLAVPPNMASSPHFLRSAKWGVVGDRLFYTSGDEFTVEFWSATGQLDRIVRAAMDAIPADAETSGEFLSKGVRYTTEKPARAFDPPIGQSLGDRQGNLWVGVHPRALNDSSVSHIVFDSSGTARAAVRWKTRFTRDTKWTLVGNWQQIDDSTLTTAALDQDDRFQVLVLPIRKPAR